MPTGVTLGTATATGTINDDDSATVSIAAANASEGSPVIFTVNLSAEASSDVVLNWSAAAGTAALSDIGVANGTARISAGMTTGMITVATVEDTLAEGDETFTVTITENTLPEGVTLGATVTATGTITDNDTATVSVANASATEGEAVEFTVSLSEAAGSDVVLNWSTTDGTAIAPGDYTPMSSGTVTIAAGATTNTFTVATVDDALVEGDETFTVTITENTLPASVSIGTTTATGTINDDDTATVSIAGDANATEGSSVIFTVNLTAQASSDVVLNWSTTDGTAMAPGDYTPMSAGTVTIAAGATTNTFTVATVEDTLVEGDETFTVTLAASGTLPDGVTLGGAMAIGTITDDDSATVSIVGAANASEGSPVIFTVSLSAEASSDVVLNWSTADDTAIAGTDYTAQTNGTVTIDAGETTNTFTVATVGDDLVESDETFIVTIAASGSLPTGVTLGVAMATGTINDNDSATVSIANASATEGEAVEFTVSLSAQASSDVVLNWSTADGTAIAPGDYTATSNGTVTIDAGETSATFTVMTVDDALAEGDETFAVTIAASGSLPDGVTLDTDIATGTITGDDGATVSLAGDASASEGAPVEFMVNLSAAVAEAVVLNWTGAGGTATAGTDYTAAGTVTIPANMTTATLRVTTSNDLRVESDETFIVTITGANLPGGVSLGDTTATGTITNDDTATVSIANASVMEGDTAEITVSLSAQVSSDVVLSWTTVDSSALFSVDYTAVDDTVTIAAGETTAMITVPTLEDTAVEGDEVFLIRFPGSSPAGVTFAGREAEVTIIDDDMATVSIVGTSADEGGAVEFTVTLDIPVTRTLLLNWSTADDTAMAPGDYTASSGGVTINAFATTDTFTVATVDDALAEGDETFTVTITENILPPGVSIGIATATGTITDDDITTVSIANASADEGQAVQFTVSLSAQASSDVVLNWSTTDGTAIAGADYTAVSSGTVTIAAGATTNTFTVAAADDDLVEGDETFTVTLTASGALPDGVTLGTPVTGDGATGTITDGDMATVSIAGDANATEGGDISFTVDLSTAADEAVVLNWTGAGGTATADTDYTAAGTATVDAGATTTTFTVATVDDALVEGDETFTITLTASGALPDGVTLGTDTAIGTITDGDTATVSIAGDANATEGGGHPLQSQSEHGGG